MNGIKVAWTTVALLAALVAGCSGVDPVVGVNELSAGGAPNNGASGASGAAPAAVGETCFSGEENVASFSGWGVDGIDIDDRSATCSSHLCVQNHFQGRVSCPYGQTAGGTGCALPGSSGTVSVPVSPQLVERQAEVASICSCQCDGAGPGPYCTCPESMQCEHLVDDLGLGGANLAGSYCIPLGSQYDANASKTPCVEPHCGAAHPF